MNKYIERTKPNYKILFIALLAFFGIIAASYGNRFYAQSVFSYPKTISIVNLYKFPLIVNIEGTEYRLDIFDTQAIQLNVRDRVDIKIMNENRDLLEQFVTHEFVTIPHITLKVLTDSLDICYFSANVNEYYRKEEKPLPKNILTFENIESDSIFRVLPSDRYYIYPGKSNIKNIPQDNQKNIIGIYPIECSYLKDEAKQIEVIKMYKDYDSQQQRDFYNSKLKEIQELKL